jgi:Protein of unknown function (DUF3800)
VLIAYIDESGDTGEVEQGGSPTYTLGCVLIDADLWPTAFDEMLAFRQRLRNTFKLPMRAEIKASSLLRNSGDLRALQLGPTSRHVIFRAHMQELDRLPARAFAVVVDKRPPLRNRDSCFNLAWEALLQRLERTSTKEKATFMVVHDEGDEEAIRRWVRKARRYLTAGSAFGGGSLQHAARLLVDDPVLRKSHHSYFVQVADLVAYAAFRAVVAPSPTLTRVCPASMWDEIGSATHSAVSALVPRSKPGIVLRQA